MKKTLWIWAILIICILLSWTNYINLRTLKRPSIIAFVGVNVIPMTSPTVLKQQTVIIQDAKITKIGFMNDIAIPKGALIIEGKDRYLMPGLADMHVHIGTETSNEAAPGQMLQYLANGITTVLNAGDFGEPVPKWAAAVRNGKLDGPTIYYAKYARGIQDGNPQNVVLTSAMQVPAYVKHAKEQGYDFIKVYNWTDKDVVEAILVEAKRQHMAVIGHIPREVGFERVLNSGMVMIAHIGSGGFYSCSFHTEETPVQFFGSLAKKVKQSGVYVATTLAVDEVQAKVWGGNEQGLKEVLHQEGVCYAHPTIIDRWLMKARIQKLYNPPGSNPGDLDLAYSMMKLLALKLQQAGVKLLLGSDSPPSLLMPGFSIHRELSILKESGFKPYNILTMATKNPGEFIGKYAKDKETFGTVEVGKRADLLLLETNPLDDISNIKKRVGVMARGQWYPENELQRKLEYTIIDGILNRSYSPTIKTILATLVLMLFSPFFVWPLAFLLKRRMLRNQLKSALSNNNRIISLGAQILAVINCIICLVLLFLTLKYSSLIVAYGLKYFGSFINLIPIGIIILTIFEIIFIITLWKTKHWSVIGIVYYLLLILTAIFEIMLYFNLNLVVGW